MMAARSSSSAPCFPCRPRVRIGAVSNFMGTASQMPHDPASFPSVRALVLLFCLSQRLFCSACGDAEDPFSGDCGAGSARDAHQKLKASKQNPTFGDLRGRAVQECPPVCALANFSMSLGGEEFRRSSSSSSSRKDRAPDSSCTSLNVCDLLRNPFSPPLVNVIPAAAGAKSFAPLLERAVELRDSTKKLLVQRARRRSSANNDLRAGADFLCHG